MAEEPCYQAEELWFSVCLILRYQGIKELALPLLSALSWCSILMTYISHKEGKYGMQLAIADSALGSGWYL